MPVLRERMEPAAGLWIAWPKRASKVETDLTEDVVRELALANRLVDNKVCAIERFPTVRTLHKHPLDAGVSLDEYQKNHAKTWTGCACPRPVRSRSGRPC